MDNDNLTIEIGEIIRKRFGNVPGFAVRLLEKMIHQDFLNEFFSKGWQGVEFCEKCLEYLDVKVDVDGEGNLPFEGRRYTFVCNHPLGGIDAVAVTAVLGRKYDGNILIMANDFLMNIKGLAPLFVPVNKVGKQTADISARVNALFDSSGQVLMFPSGKVSRKSGGVIRDPEWKPTFLRKSISYGRDIIPIYFDGKNSERFYTLGQIEKALKLKFPLAMAFLPDELYKGRGKTFRMNIGKPIPIETFTKEKTLSEWSQWLRDRVYDLNVY